MTEQTQVTATPTPTETPPASPVNPVGDPAAAPPAPLAAEAEPAKDLSPENDPKFASKFAALSRREQAIRTRESAIKAREGEFKSWQDQVKLAEADPLKYMESRGWTFDKLTQLALNDGKKPAEMRIQELEAKLDREAKEREESAKKSADTDLEQKRNAFLSNAKGYLEQNKEKYELTANEDEGPELLHNVMWAAYDRDGTKLTLEQAADIVEKHFEDVIDQKYAKLTKVQAKFKPKEAPTTPAAPPSSAAPRAASPTLTNTQAASVPTPSTSKALSVEESKQLAAKLLRWT